MSDQEHLLAAYRTTDYWVDDAPQGPFRIHIGELNPAPLEHLLAETGLEEWAYLTACNPASQVLSAEENAQRMAQLESQLQAPNLHIYHGRGVGTQEDWQPEASLLVLGITEEQARHWGQKFGQNAIVVGRRGEPARLLWIATTTANESTSPGFPINTP